MLLVLLTSLYICPVQSPSTTVPHDIGVVVLGGEEFFLGMVIGVTGQLRLQISSLVVRSLASK